MKNPNLYYCPANDMPGFLLDRISRDERLQDERRDDRDADERQDERDEARDERPEKILSRLFDGNVDRFKFLVLRFQSGLEVLFHRRL